MTISILQINWRTGFSKIFASSEVQEGQLIEIDKDNRAKGATSKNISDGFEWYVPQSRRHSHPLGVVVL